jgi:hypothetical protein
LLIAVFLIVDNYALLTGSDSAIVNGLPWLLVAVAVIGFIVGSVRPLHAEVDVFGIGEVSETSVEHAG